jgi:hypothetical protein
MSPAWVILRLMQFSRIGLRHCTARPVLVSTAIAHQLMMQLDSPIGNGHMGRGTGTGAARARARAR